MSFFIYYRVETTLFGMMLGFNIDSSDDYDRCIKLTRHDIDLVRIHHFQIKQWADTSIAELQGWLEDLKARMRAAEESENRSQDDKTRLYHLIETRERTTAEQKKSIEGTVARGKNMVDKLVDQLAKLQKEQTEKEELWRRMVIIDRYQPGIPRR